MAANLTAFPVLIDLSSDTELAANARDDGFDILFTSSDGATKLSHEIETFSGTSGALVAWVKVPSLSSTCDTSLYLSTAMAQRPIKKMRSTCGTRTTKGPGT